MEKSCLRQLETLINSFNVYLKRFLKKHSITDLGKPFKSKKFTKIEWCTMLSIYGMSYLIYLIIGTQIGANFTGKVVNCVLKL